MSDEKQIILKVDVKPGLNLGRQWIPAGKTVNVPKSRAESLIKSKKCSEQPDGTAVDFPAPYAPQSPASAKKSAEAFKESLNSDASALADWPAYMQLNKGGLTSVEGLRAYLEANPNDWDTKLELTAEDKAAVLAQLKKTEKPKAPPKGKE
jgi:hypothetical protein